MNAKNLTMNIKRIDSSLPLPEYQTDGSVAFDLSARVTIAIKPWEPTLIPLNIIAETPKGYFFLLTCRSSLPLKKKLMVANSVGIIDQDYCGENDEIKLQVINFSNATVVVEKGERIAQGMLLPIEIFSTFNELQQVSDTSRGGFGSTGGHKK